MSLYTAINELLQKNEMSLICSKAVFVMTAALSYSEA